MPFPFKNVSVKSMCFSFTSSHFSRSNSSRDSNPAYDQWMGDSITPGLYIGKYKVKGGVKSWSHLAEYFFRWFTIDTMSDREHTRWQHNRIYPQPLPDQ